MNAHAMNNHHTTRATIALRQLGVEDPVFGALLLWLKHRDIPENAGWLPNHLADAVAFTDGRAVYYGKRFAEMTIKEQIGVCAHEIMHVSFRHIRRGRALQSRFGGNFDPYIFNVATDAIINQTLLLARFTLPRPCIVLVELLKEVFGETVTPEDALKEYNAEKLYVRLMQKRDQMCGPSGGGAGSSSAGLARAYAEGKDFEGDMDMSADAGGKDDAQEESEWQQRVSQAMAIGRLAGRGIGKLGHILSDLPETKTPWELLIRNVVTKAVTRAPRPSLARPTKRWLAQDSHARLGGHRQPVYEPGIVKQNSMPRVFVGVDVSGSISDDLLAMFASEIAGIGNRTGSEIHVAVFDTKVLSVTRLSGTDFEAEVKKISFARGGGTSFVDVVEKAKEVDPSIIVILTDLYGPFGEAPGSIPVIWAIPQDEPPSPVPFGDVISLAQ